MSRWNVEPDDNFRIPRGYRRKRHHQKYRKSGPQQFFVGFAMTVGFGIAFYLLIDKGFWWLIFPLVFGGFIPMVTGLSRMFSGTGEKKRVPKEKELKQLAEKMVLDAAHKHKGRVSVLQVAKATALSIEEAQETLESMAKKGYAGMTVDAQGRIQYEFPEFLPNNSEEQLEDDIKRF